MYIMLVHLNARYKYVQINDKKLKFSLLNNGTQNAELIMGGRIVSRFLRLQIVSFCCEIILPILSFEEVLGCKNVK